MPLGIFLGLIEEVLNEASPTEMFGSEIVNVPDVAYKFNGSGEEELQEVIVEIDKPVADYTARDWYGYFKKVPKLYWIIFGVVMLLPIIFGLIFCCCTREPKYTTPTPRF